MDTTENTLTAEDAAAIAAAIKQQQRINRMLDFAAWITAEDCAGISGSGEKTQYKAPGKIMMKPAGNPPRDYTAVELLVDFKAAIAKGDYDEAARFYYPLRRMLHS